MEAVGFKVGPPCQGVNGGRGSGGGVGGYTIFVNVTVRRKKILLLFCKPLNGA